MKLKVLASGSKGNCYLLEGERETLILECGISYKAILQRLDFHISNVVGCLVTHEHKDHSIAAVDLIKRGIDIYSSAGTIGALGVNSYHLKVIKSEEKFKVGEFIILPFQTEHDATEPLGFLIQHKEVGKFLFITDSYYCRYKFKAVNHILIECNYSNEIAEANFKAGKIHPVLMSRLMKFHFSLGNVKEFLKASDLQKVRNIVLIHLSERNSNADLFKSDIEKITGTALYVADRGLEINLGIDVKGEENDNSRA